MNIFEDLIEELKEENLLESTVIETKKEAVKQPSKKEEPIHAEKVVVEKAAEAVVAEKVPVENVAVKPVVPETVAAPVLTIEKTVEEEIPVVETPVDLPSEAVEMQEAVARESEAEFYRRRAMNEVAFLQIVEQVFASAEREQLKIIPKSYDDLIVKKVLHNFLHLSPDADAVERSKAEFNLLQETESWHSSLTLRDERLTTAHLRRFCETSRPPLSAPALVALARFYRNSPFSEPVRNKFDLIVTRLFSKETEKNLRETIFKREELAAHFSELYAEWSSVPLYSTETNDELIAQTVAKFESFMREADDALEFDDLIKSNFYTRLHSFKRATQENFYAPLVTAVGIESNVHIGNRYVELLEQEKNRGSVSSLEDRYGFAHDDAVSEVTGKTLTLIELLKQKKAEPVVVEKPRIAEPIAEKVSPSKAKEKVKEKATEKTAESNPSKWKIIAVVGLLAIFATIYFATKSDDLPEQMPVNVSAATTKFSLENSMLKDFLQEANIENQTLKGTVSPVWDEMREEARRDALNQTLTIGKEKGWKKVQLQTAEGKTVGTADGSSLLILK